MSFLDRQSFVAWCHALMPFQDGVASRVALGGYRRFIRTVTFIARRDAFKTPQPAV